MISVILYGRNDSHGYNLHKRAAISINCIAETLTDQNDEIIFVDCNSPDDMPTFPEAIQDTFTEKAKELLRIIRLRPALFEINKRGSHLPVLEPLARNIAIRRSNQNNRWILSTNTDMVFVSRDMNKSLSDLTADLPDGFYELPRFEVPEILWESLDRKNPKEIISKLNYYGKSLRLNDAVESRPDIYYDGPGDFQLFLREQIFEIDAFDEEMVLGWHVDSNICKRLYIYNKNSTQTLIDKLFAYHCDHTRQSTLAHNFNRKENDQKKFCENVTSPFLPAQRKNWGLPDEYLEEIKLSGEHNDQFAKVVESLVGGLKEPYSIDYFITESYNHGLLYDNDHVLPFILNHLLTVNPQIRLGYWGCNIDLLVKIARFLLKYFPDAVLFYDGDLIKYNVNFITENFPENCIELTQEYSIEILDLYLFDAGLNDFECERRERGIYYPKGTVNLLKYLDKFYDCFINTAYHEKMASRKLPRKFILTSCQHTWFEVISLQLIGVVLAPFSSRVRAGYLRKDAFESTLISPSFSSIVYYDDKSFIQRISWILKENISQVDFYNSSLKLQSLIDSYKKPEEIQQKIMASDYNALDLSLLVLKAEIYSMNREKGYAAILIKLFEIINTLKGTIELPEELNVVRSKVLNTINSLDKIKTGHAEKVRSFQVILKAPLSDRSGYADESRNILIGLDALNVDVKAIPIKWSKSEAELSEEEKNKIEELANNESQNKKTICIYNIFPKFYKIDKSASYYIGRTMFETDSLPEDWVASANKMDEIWVPSKFNFETFSRAGIDSEKLFIIPEGIDTERFKLDIRALEIKGRRKFNFLSVFDWSFRKGWDLLLQAFIEEFDENSNVSLTLKVWSSYGKNIEGIKKEAENYLKLNKLCDELPSNIIFIDDNLALKDIPALYKSADAFVLPTHGEGWGRTFMEAMLMELPVIGTRWSGQLEFMNDDNSYLIDCKIEDISDNAVLEVPAFKNHKWAMPSIHHMKSLMKTIYMNYNQAKKRGKKARENIIEKFDRKIVARIILDRLNEINERKMMESNITNYNINNFEVNKCSFREKQSISWTGPQYSCSSLALINREYISSLIDNGYHITTYSKDDDNNGKLLNFNFNKIKDKLSNQSGSADINIYHQWPPDLNAPKDGKWVVMQPWEFGSLPKEWVETFKTKVDELWVPSNIVKNMFVESGIPEEKIYIVPNGFDPEIFNSNVLPLKLKTKKKFKFLFVGGTIYRKGIDLLLEAYVSVFKDSDDVCLVIKDIGGKSFYQGMNFKDRIDEIKAIKGTPEIEYIDSVLNEIEMAGLYKACNILVHPYRGEGFGLPVLEAMACSLPVIVTKGGSTDDFCNSENSFQISSERIYLGDMKIGNYTTVNYPWFLEPSKDELRSQMKIAFSNPEKIQNIGKKGFIYVHKRFTWDISFNILESRIKGLSIKSPVRFSIKKEKSLLDFVKISLDAIETGKYDFAIECLLQAEQIYPKDSDAPLTLAEIYDLLGNTYFIQKDLENAKVFWEKELECDPSSSNACLGLGKIFYAAGMLKEAKTMFEWAVQNNESNDNAAQNLRFVNIQLGLDDGNNTLLENLLIIDTSNETEIITLAEKLISEKKYDMARTILLRNFGENSSNVSILNTLSVIEILNDKYSEALNYIERIFTIDPDNQIAIDNLVIINKMLNNN